MNRLSSTRLNRVKKHLLTRLLPDARVTLTSGELNGYVCQELMPGAPAGVRDLRIQLGSGTASGAVLINFSKRRPQGTRPVGSC